MFSLAYTVQGSRGITVAPAADAACHRAIVVQSKIPILVNIQHMCKNAWADLEAFAHSFAKTVNPHLCQT